MSIARVKVWIPGDILTAADLNAEFNNILDNPISLISPTTGAINFDNQAHTNLPVTALSASSGTNGDVVTRSSGVVVWQAVQRLHNIPLRPISAEFSTANFPTLTKSTDSNWPQMRLAYDPTTAQTAMWYVPLSSALGSVSTATLEIFITATSSSGTTVWSVNTRAADSGSTWNQLGSTNVSSTVTFTSTAGGVFKFSIPLTASSWTFPSVVQVAIKRHSTDAGDASTGLHYLTGAALRITV